MHKNCVYSLVMSLNLFREKKEKEHLPRRSSLRLQRMDPMGVPLPEIPKDDQQTVSEQVMIQLVAL